MRDSSPTPLTGDCWFYLSMHEITHTMNVPTQTILEIIEEGIINADKDAKQQWVFNSECLRKIRIVLQLTKDLGVNLAGAALAIDLLDEIEQLKKK